METGTLGQALEHEHHEIDRAIEGFLAGDGERREQVESLRRAIAALRRHIYLEEEFLFPPMRDAGFVAPIVVMLREHGELWQTMEEIERDLAADASDALPGQCKWLLSQLAKHNAKEEPILYPHADAVLGSPGSEELIAFLESGRMPAGWACARADA